MTSLIRARGSIRRRLTLQLAAIAAILSILSWGMVRSFALEAAERTQDSILAASATSIADELRSEQGEVRLEIPYSAFSMLGTAGQDRVFYRVLRDGRTLTGYDDLPVDRLSEAPGQPVFSTVSYRGDSVRLATVARTVMVDAAATQVVVAVGQTRSGVGAITERLSLTAAALSVAFFLLAVGLSFLVARGALKPLNEIAGAVGRRGPTDLSPLRRETPQELVPLLTALNRLMERLAGSLRRSEDFIAEAAHRVRTPLATVRTQAEIALHSVEKPANKQVLRRVIRAVDESSRSAGQLLDHAMVSFRAAEMQAEPLSLDELIAEVCEGLRPMAEMMDIAIDTRLEPVRMEGDAILLQNAIRNILDNAIKYSPSDSTIRIRLTRVAEGARVEIEDEGRGFGTDEAADLVARFRRGANVGEVVGSGLGLTIAEDVVGAHGGRMELGQARGGKGACVSLVLPG